MDHLAQDLTLALEDSEPCGPANFKINRRWGIKRRTRSAGNLHLCLTKSAENHSDDSSSSNNEVRMENQQSLSPRASVKPSSLHQSDSDDMSFSLAKNINKSNSLRIKNNIPTFVSLQGGKYGVMNKINYSLESDSFNEHSPARPNIRRKRKLKRMCIDETTPIPPCGKRKRPQNTSSNTFKSLKNSTKINTLNQSLIEKLEKFCVHSNALDDDTTMETQCVVVDDDHHHCEVGSESSSLSWSGGEGHDGDDELTDWAPQPDPAPIMDCFNDDPREIRAGCRRLHNERPGFSITTGANERVARFLQDTGRSELKLCGAEQDKLGQLAALYSLDLWFEGANSLLRKTSRTPCMQPPQRHHSGLSTGNKKIRTHEAKFV